MKNAYNTWDVVTFWACVFGLIGGLLKGNIPATGFAFVGALGYLRLLAKE